MFLTLSRRKYLELLELQHNVFIPLFHLKNSKLKYGWIKLEIHVYIMHFNKEHIPPKFLKNAIHIKITKR